MNSRILEHPTRIATAVAAACALYAAPLVLGPILSTSEGGRADIMSTAMAAQDSGHSSGGHESGGGKKPGASDSGHGAGGHTSGGHSSGGHSSGGHSGGGQDSGSSHASGGGHGGEKAQHGLRPEHAGHASGMHKSQEHKGQGGHGSQGGTHKGGSHDLFGGGTGLSGSDQVLEGIAIAAASPEQAREQHSFGPGPRAQYRFRYWGGRGIDDDDGGGDDGGGGGGGDDPPGGGGGGGSTAFLLQGSDRCDDHAPGSITGWQRFAGQNMARVDRVVLALAPGVAGSEYMMVANLVANFQDEMEKATPDAVLAGTYLGLARRGGVLAAQDVSNLAFGLCVPVDARQANDIAQAAQHQQVALDR
jgi:hypothetical protein